MPFPVTFANAAHDTPRALAVRVMTQLKAGVAVHPELIALVTANALSAEEATGLAAALVQTRAPAAIIAGCHLAHHLRAPSLAELLLIAHDALDMGTLLQQAHDDQSIEDLLLGALADCVPSSGPVLDAALTRLRHAGLVRQELLLLLRTATPNDLEDALPAIVLEGLPADTADAIAKKMAQGGEASLALARGLRGMPARHRTPLWAALVRHKARRSAPDAVTLLFPPTEAAS